MVEARSSGSVRDRLLEAADALFYEEGIHTVGVDRVIERAGVAKASLYGTFGSKDNLVRTYLEGRSLEIRERTAKRLALHDGPRARILAVFDLLSERVADGSYRGCPFVNACAEGPAGPTPAREVAARHRAWRRDLFTEQATHLGVRDAAEMARRLSLLYDGALIGASMDSNASAASTARELAERLLDEQLAGKAAGRASAKPAVKRRKVT